MLLLYQAFGLRSLVGELRLEFRAWSLDELVEKQDLVWVRMSLLENLDVTVVWWLKVRCGLQALEFLVAIFKIGKQLQVAGIQDMSPDVIERGNRVVV